MSLNERVRSILDAYVEVPEDDKAPLALDSLSLVQLIEELEEAFDFVARAADISPSNFGTVAALCAFLAEKGAR